jgi:membrane protease YdiL (CAAX protease family)
LAKLGSRDVLELGLAFAVSLGAVFLVNSPSYHYVSAALATYLGLLVGIPLVSARLRGSDFASEQGLRGVTALSWKLFAVTLLLPLVFVPMLWQSDIAPTIMFAVVAAPMCEEVFFRGYLAGRLGGLGVVTASMTSAVLFAAFHLGAQQFRDPVSFALLVFLGLVYAPVFLVTRSVYVTASIHAAWNLFAYLVTALPASPLGYVSFAALGLIMMADLLFAILEIAQAKKKAAVPYVGGEFPPDLRQLRRVGSSWRRGPSRQD